MPARRLGGPADQPRKRTQQVLLREAAPRLLRAGAGKLTVSFLDLTRIRTTGSREYIPKS